MIPPHIERTRFGQVQLFRERESPSPMRADVGGESAAMTDDGGLHVRAKVMVSRKALVTVHVATRVPADADTLSDLARLGIWTNGRDPSDNFVAENRGVL